MRSFYRARRRRVIFIIYRVWRGPALRLKSEAVVAVHLEPSVTHDGESCSDIRIATKDQQSEPKSQCPQMKGGRMAMASLSCERKGQGQIMKQITSVEEGEEHGTRSGARSQVQYTGQQRH